MNIAVGEDQQPKGTASNLLKENTKECRKQHGKRHREYYSSSSQVSEEHQTGYSYEQPG